MANEVEWIKLTTDMFDNQKIKELRRMPEGNNIVLIWVMLLTMAGKCNSGGMIIISENITYSIESLADELKFEISTVKLALAALEKFGMIYTSESEIVIANWYEYQSKDGLEKIREQTKKRVAKYRENKKICNVTSNVTVTQSSYSSSNNNISSLSNSTNTNKDIYTENIDDIDIKDNKDISKGNKKPKEEKHHYGEYGNVLLTDKEFEKLAKDYGVEKRDAAIKFLDMYIPDKGYNSKSHNMALRRWVFDAVERENIKKPNTQSFIDKWRNA